MAMYVETKRDNRVADATTLEEAAEELLNGLLCHYEPPDPRTIRKLQQEGGAPKKGQRGILRASSKFFRSRRSKRREAKSVRWEDEQNKVKTPAMYDIGKGCQDALAECVSNDADLDNETGRLAELSAQRTPKPITKRVRVPTPYRESRDKSANPTQNSSGIEATRRTPDVDYSAMGSKLKKENDPISSYRDATMSPKTESTENGNGLFDDQGNLVTQESNQNESARSGQPTKYGPPPSPAVAKNEPSKPRQQTPYKQPPQTPVEGTQPGTLCGMMCDPKFLNCEVDDGDYPNDHYDAYPPPPPPPPPPPRVDQSRQEDPENSLISGSEGESEDEERNNHTPTKQRFRDRFRRKSKKNAGPQEGGDRVSGRKSRGRSRSPGRRSRSPGRSKSPARSTKQDRKYPMSPLSFITGNRSFSRSPRSKEAREAARTESEANYSLQSTGSSTISKRRTSKSPRHRKWFGSRGRSKNREEALLQAPSMDTNTDWAYSEHARMAYEGYNNDPRWLHARSQSLERPDQLSLSTSRSYDRLDYVDRSRMSDYDYQDQALRPARSRSLDRDDHRGRSRLSSYDRPESHIGLSRMSFDEEDLLRPSRSRSLDRQDQQLRRSHSRSLEGQELQLQPTRSRSLDRQDQRAGTLFDSAYDPRQVRFGRTSSIDRGDLNMPTRRSSFDGNMDPRRSSYPLVPPQHRGYSQGFPHEAEYGHPQAVNPNHQRHTFWPQAAPRETRQEFLDRQYNSFMASRSPSYPPQMSPGPSRRRSFDYSESGSRSQPWWGFRRSQSMEQRKPAAEPPAAIYSHEPRQEVCEAQRNSIYSHDPRVARIPTVAGREMPPTPTQRGTLYSPYEAHPFYGDARTMPPMAPTPKLTNNVYTQNNHGRQDYPMQLQRDPTPRNRLIDMVRAPLQSQPPAVNQPAPPNSRSSKPFNVAEEIHRVSWGEPKSQTTQEETTRLSSANYRNPQTSVLTEEEMKKSIPATLPGTEKKKIAVPPPPPPPPHQLPPKQPQVKENLKPMTSGVQLISENQQFVPSPVQYTDLADENRPLGAVDQKKEGKGRKLLGIFGRSKRKEKNYGSNKSEEDRNDEADLDGSILSDAVLRDRHDRYVTKL